MQTKMTRALGTELTRFASGLDRLAQSVAQGVLSESEGQQRRAGLTATYAAEIARMVNRLTAGEEDEATGVRLLMDLGVDTTVARRLAAESSLRDITGWIAYADRSPHVKNPAGLVVARLRERVPAPRDTATEHRRMRNVTGRYSPYNHY